MDVPVPVSTETPQPDLTPAPSFGPEVTTDSHLKIHGLPRHSPLSSSSPVELISHCWLRNCQNLSVNPHHPSTYNSEKDGIRPASPRLDSWASPDLFDESRRSLHLSPPWSTSTCILRSMKISDSRAGCCGRWDWLRLGVTSSLFEMPNMEVRVCRIWHLVSCPLPLGFPVKQE
ncbi:hypothetical protein BDN72DRAFT_208087 [Pluteus cervinus]|uniref:Uncharacterized protein n=1 Tax=Pluteus cervinus TaxID=181527 RepID=A0ACD3AHT2_9AGAR|nr:hypothetical protein BDN72DRAFT_208087 [Pluteus cervinus]